MLSLSRASRLALFLALTPAAPLALVLAPAPALAQAHMHPLPRRGDHLPDDVLRGGPNVNVSAARLRSPPEGYGWFQIHGAYVLASLQTGLIVEVVKV